MNLNYLKVFNLTALLFWVLFFVNSVGNSWELNRIGLFFLNIAQLLALLEIFHAVKGWVSSSPFTTALQVASRIFILFLLNLHFGDPQYSFFGIRGIPLITFAWGITEIVRYSFYSTQLFELKTPFLLALRYGLFILLYPIGVLGEFLIAFTSIQSFGGKVNLINTIMVLILLSYFVFFPKMYGHMLTQRNKKLIAPRTN